MDEFEGWAGGVDDVGERNPLCLPRNNASPRNVPVSSVATSCNNDIYSVHLSRLAIVNYQAVMANYSINVITSITPRSSLCALVIALAQALCGHDLDYGSAVVDLPPEPVTQTPRGSLA